MGFHRKVPPDFANERCEEIVGFCRIKQSGPREPARRFSFRYPTSRVRTNCTVTDSHEMVSVAERSCGGRVDQQESRDVGCAFRLRVQKKEQGAVLLVVDFAKVFEKVQIVVVWQWAMFFGIVQRNERIFSVCYAHERRLSFETRTSEPIQTIPAVFPEYSWSHLLRLVRQDAMNHVSCCTLKQEKLCTWMTSDHT